ncbi:MAG: PadR family transcriptional regulator PadR [Verrucomicrobiales bacterium]|jgi:PadR family transcriptional regulator PadR
MLPKDLVAASMRPLVLTLLSEREGYGYDLIQRMRAHSDAQLEWTEGTLYPVLHRLEKEGLVRAEWQRAETGRRRKYYFVTAAGSAALEIEKQNWLTVHQLLADLWKTKPSS